MKTLPLQKKGWLAQRFDDHGATGLRLTLILITAGIGLAIFCGLIEGLHEHGLVAGFDHMVGQAVIGLRRPWLTVIMEIFTGIAGSKGAALFLLLTTVLLWNRRQRPLAGALILGTAVELGIGTGLKLLIARPRPSDAHWIVSATSYSFPSGHTLDAVVLYGLAAYFIYRSKPSRIHHVITLVSWLLFVCLVAMSRIYLGVHYASDTLASICLGGAGLCLGLAYLDGHERILPTESFSRSTSRRLSSVFGIVALCVVLGRQFFI